MTREVQHISCEDVNEDDVKDYHRRAEDKGERIQDDLDNLIVQFVQGLTHFPIDGVHDFKHYIDERTNSRWVSSNSCLFQSQIFFKSFCFMGGNIYPRKLTEGEVIEGALIRLQRIHENAHDLLNQNLRF